MTKTVDLDIPKTAAERIAAQEWKCAGCGAVSPNRAQSCDCPTGVVTRHNEQAWKVGREELRMSELAETIKNYSDIVLVGFSTRLTLSPYQRDLIIKALTEQH
ncbi:MAG: hypothetical protein AB7R40_23730 [Nitrospiraceae bacterium]